MMRLEAGRLSDPTGALRYPPRPSDMTGWADKAPQQGEPRR
jgi:cell division transport system ATP-binding protein